MFLGIDFGKKYIGTSLADENLKIASPYKVFIELKEQDLFKKLNNIILEKNIIKIIVGYPIGLSGKETAQTRKTSVFIKKLKKETNIKVVESDERFTSKIADNSLKNMKNKQAKIFSHAVAAAIILQDYLDYNK
ncbi:Holliday junction resolvase RuvX [Patescibacteria group bacterium]|nr:Holliday junction resolvase RuvX [Patescibacteria group bacterium]